MKQDTRLDLEHILKLKKQNVPRENENLKKSWPAEIKRGWIPQT